MTDSAQTPSNPAVENRSGHSSANERPARAGSARPLVLAFSITFVVLLVELVGGLVTGSLALLADAGHMGTDAAALALAIFARWLAARPATPARSFGYLRAEVLAAVVNAAALIVASIFILWEAVERLDEPPEIESLPMLGVAVVGLLANAAAAWVLSRGSGHAHDLNTRGAFLHVLGDMLGSVGAISAALIMLATDWYLADPILSAGIGLLILWNTWRLLREAVDVLLEAAPASLDVPALRRSLEGVPGVTGVHDLHVWTVTSGLIALSGHVEVDGRRPWSDLLLDMATLLRDRFGISHATLQPEEPDSLPEPFRGCSLDTPEGRSACLVPLDRAATTGHEGHNHR